MNWFTLTIILSGIASCLILSLRAITPKTNPFAFMAVVVGVAATLLAGFCHYQGISLIIESKVLGIAIIAGISVALLDAAFIFMFRTGVPVTTAMPAFRVSAILLSALIGILFLHESVTVLKFFGIILACFAAYFLTTSSPKKDELK